MRGSDVHLDTIVALATPGGRSAVALVRLSGRDALGILRRLAPRLPENVRPRRPYLCGLRDAAGETIDSSLVTYFAAPASFTGEDVAEIRPHGSPAVVERLLAAAVAAGAQGPPARASSPSGRFVPGRSTSSAPRPSRSSSTRRPRPRPASRRGASRAACRVGSRPCARPSRGGGRAFGPRREEASPRTSARESIRALSRGSNPRRPSSRAWRRPTARGDCCRAAAALRSSAAPTPASRPSSTPSPDRPARSSRRSRGRRATRSRPSSTSAGFRSPSSTRRGCARARTWSKSSASLARARRRSAPTQ